MPNENAFYSASAAPVPFFSNPSAILVAHLPSPRHPEAKQNRLTPPPTAEDVCSRLRYWLGPPLLSAHLVMRGRASKPLHFGLVVLDSANNTPPRKGWHMSNDTFLLLLGRYKRAARCIGGGTAWRGGQSQGGQNQ
jgi:hypothetical protein